jgi:hypothetical protein
MANAPKATDFALLKEQPCHCGKKSNYEVKIARTSDHIFTRKQVCSYFCAIEWLRKQRDEVGAKD